MCCNLNYIALLCLEAALHCLRIALHYLGIALHCLGIALHCLALHFIALPCMELHCLALFSLESHFIALDCIALDCISLDCITLNCISLNVLVPSQLCLCCIAVAVVCRNVAKQSLRNLSCIHSSCGMLHAQYGGHACSDLQECVLAQKPSWLHSVAGCTLDQIRPQPNLAISHPC